MRTTIGKALMAALRTGPEHTAKEREHAREWLAGTVPEYASRPDFKIVIRPADGGLWKVKLVHGSLGFSASDHNVLVEVRLAL